MNHERYSHIAHAGMGYCNPFPGAVFDHVLDIVGLGADAQALDVGSGKAELLIRLAETRGVHGLGIERSPYMYAEAQARRRARGVEELVELRQGDAAELLPGLTDGSFNLVACVGSTHAIGHAEAALREMVRLVRPGGFVLWLEPYWKKPPAADYLHQLGATEDDHRTHAGNVELGAKAGLVPLLAYTASEREYDEYEWAYARGIESFVAAYPDDPDAPAMLQRSRRWRELVLGQGRETLGVGLYLLRRR